jgi:hypothetical protein
MPPKTKGSSNAIRKDIRFNPDLLAEINSALEEDGGTFAAFIEDAARLKLSQRQRQRHRNRDAKLTAAAD